MIENYTKKALRYQGFMPYRKRCSLEENRGNLDIFR